VANDMCRKRPLGGSWKLSCLSNPGRGISGIHACVPGNVHTALLEAGLIKDPFHGRNAELCQWVEDETWQYRSLFHLDGADIRRHMELVCDGLDTFADIVLNGNLVGHTENMFVPHVADVSDLLNAGSNELEIRFHPYKTWAEGKNVEKYGGAFTNDRVHVRKAQCSFGWDWVYRFVGAGIWRDIHLLAYEVARIDDVRIQPRISKGTASVGVDIGCVGEVERALGAEIEIALQDELVARTSVMLKGRRTSASVVIPDPKLWWPNGYGEPHLYTARVRLKDRDRVLDERSIAFGLRSVRIDQHPEAQGKTFHVVVNDTPVFCKGANWIPSQILFGNETRQRYETLVRLARGGGYNMLRVWGGGVYEHDDFYDLCDRMGIMIWQDFMFACGRYPEDAAFNQEVKQEAETVVRRLRNHPSIALWCGSNENLMHSGPGEDVIGRHLHEELLPSVCKTLDPDRPYWPSSPYGGRTNMDRYEGDTRWTLFRSSDLEKGDILESVRRHRAVKARFPSEVSAHGYPPRRTLREFLADEELDEAFGPTHRFHCDGFKIMTMGPPSFMDYIRVMAEKVFGVPDEPENLYRTRECVQAWFMQREAEHFRRQKWFCGGLLFWMYNDCWPAVSQSHVDYYLRPKASYFAAKRTFKPMLVSIECYLDGVYPIWVCNDTPRAVEGNLSWQLIDFEGAPSCEGACRVTVPANRSEEVCRPFEHGAVPERPASQLLTAELALDGGEILYAHKFFGLPKDLELPEANVTCEVTERTRDAATLQLKTDNFAYIVFIENDCYLSDNYFDMMPRSTKRIRCESRGGQAIEPIKLHWWNRPH